MSDQPRFHSKRHPRARWVAGGAVAIVVLLVCGAAVGLARSRPGASAISGEPTPVPAATAGSVDGSPPPIVGSAGDGQAAGEELTGDPASRPTGSAPPPEDLVAAHEDVAEPTAPSLPPGVGRPSWLHTRPLQVGPDGQALSAPTPAELVVRRIPTVDLLPPPADGRFQHTIQPVPAEVLARSTWSSACPVAAEELSYVTMSFWGFDDRAHTGEMLLNAAWAEDVVAIFADLYAEAYPIEEMRIVNAEELEGTPTGDTNNTSAFVCRPVRGGAGWSQHAYGLAVDLNPFINPYQRGDRILPELAEAYLHRDDVRPGMLADGHTAVTGFDALGWGWGGRWSSLTDWMHFSANGR